MKDLREVRSKLARKLLPVVLGAQAVIGAFLLLGQWESVPTEFLICGIVAAETVLAVSIAKVNYKLNIMYREKMGVNPQ